MSWIDTFAQLAAWIDAIFLGLAEAINDLCMSAEGIVETCKAFTSESPEHRQWARRQWREDQRLHQQEALRVLARGQGAQAWQGPPVWRLARDML